MIFAVNGQIVSSFEPFYMICFSKSVSSSYPSRCAFGRVFPSFINRFLIDCLAFGSVITCYKFASLLK